MIKQVYAQVVIGEKFAPAERFSNLGQLVSTLSQNFLLVAGVIMLAIFLYAGFMYISNAGSEDAQAMQKWKGTLTYAVIGFVIIFSAFWIVQIINYVTNGSLGQIFR